MRTLAFTFCAVIAAGALIPAAAAEQPHAGTLTVAEIAIGSGYDRESRSLTGVGEVFPASTERLWCRTRITGASAPTTIAHVWYHRGQTVARVDLDVGSADWRTVSSKMLLPEWTGPWEVRVVDADGNLLGSVSVTVE